MLTLVLATILSAVSINAVLVLVVWLALVLALFGGLWWGAGKAGMPKWVGWGIAGLGLLIAVLLVVNFFFRNADVGGGVITR